MGFGYIYCTVSNYFSSLMETCVQFYSETSVPTTGVSNAFAKTLSSNRSAICHIIEHVYHILFSFQQAKPQTTFLLFDGYTTRTR